MYEPLDASKHQIRLLHLLPGEDNDKLWCTFSVASLDDNPEYEAASYVWGSWDDPGSIEVGADEDVVSITKNLQSVLRSVRFEEDPRTLWVDALCINQQDLGERGSQVNMMARVYEQAKGVLAYLGDHFDGCERAINVVHQIAADPSLHLLSEEPDTDNNILDVMDKCDVKERHEPHIIHWTEPRKVKDEARKGVGLEDPELLGQLRTLLDTPWMTRVWTVQEATCAKEVTLLYGQTAIPGDAMIRFCLQRNQHIHCCNPKPMSQQWQDFWTLANNWNALYRARGIGRTSSLQVLENCRARSATDPRDKVYSMLGIGNTKWATCVPADYTVPTEVTYIRAVVADLNLSQLDFLSFCHARDSPGIRCNPLPPRLDLPSWVPDWSVPTTDLFTNHAIFMLNVGYRAHGGQPGVLKITLPEAFVESSTEHLSASTSAPNRLTALGVTISTVSYFSELLMMSSNTKEARTFALASIFDHLSVSDHCSDTYGKTNKTLQQAFCLLAMGGVQCSLRDREFKRLDRSGTISSQLFEAWWRGRKHSHDAIFPMFDQVSSLMMRHRRFVKLENGYFGFAHQDCQIGDLVVALGGGHVPYILRPSPTGDYTFIGTAYVQDMMDGEAWEMEKEHEKFTII